MHTRQSAPIITSLILVFTLAACSPSSGTAISATATRIIIGAPSTGGTVTASTPISGAPTYASAGGCTNAYFPVASGATWFYASTGGVGGDYSYITTMAGVGDTGFTTSDELSVGITRTITWGCKAGNLSMLQTGSTGGLTSNTGMKVDVASVSANGYVIPASFAVGQTWSETLGFNTTNYGTAGQVKGTGQSSNQTSCTAGDTESVTVPAGKFEAVKIDCSTNMTTIATINGAANPPVTFAWNSTKWYASGVGMVKSTSTGDSGDETIVLSSYTIP
jgi:hypothetical protein